MTFSGRRLPEKKRRGPLFFFLRDCCTRE